MPETAQEWFEAAQRALEETGDGNAILDCTGRALELDPGHEGAKQLRLMVYAQLIPMLEQAGKWESLLKLGREIQERALHPTVGAMVETGALLELGRHEECQRAARVCIERDPEDAHAHYLLGTSLLRQERFDEALPPLERACALEAEHGEARINRGMCLDELGRVEDAIEAYDEALALVPEVVHLHGNRGNSLRRLGRLDEALASYERALELAPGDPHNGRLRAEVLIELERAPEAIGPLLELSGVTEAEYRAWAGKGKVPPLDGDAKAVAMLLAVMLRSGPGTLREVAGARG